MHEKEAATAAAAAAAAAATATAEASGVPPLSPSAKCVIYIETL